MPPTIRGVYREGKIELTETPPDVCAGTFVVVILSTQSCGFAGLRH